MQLMPMLSKWAASLSPVRHMSEPKPSIRQRALTWRKSHITDQVYLFLVASAVGAVSGFCAFMLKWLIVSTRYLLTVNFTPSSFNYPLLLLPLTGILLTGFFQRYVVRVNLTHGVSQLMHHYAIHRLRLPSYLTWSLMVASTFTLGFGGSAGSEGPIAYTGAAIGSNLAQWFGVDRRMLYIMVGCGAGAGIAGIFKAPVGGALFALEVLKVEFTTVSVIALLIACIVAAMTAYMLSGFTVDLSYVQLEQFEPSMALYIALLGVVCGLYSVYYSTVMHRMNRFYESIRRPWLQYLVSGSLLSVILFFFPAMFGEGYDVMTRIIDGDFSQITAYGGILRNLSDPTVLLIAVGAIALLKSFAASATNSGGGVAGDFAPTLFAGCFVGMFFASALNTWFHLDIPVPAMAFLGMAGVMSGAIRAPIMALFLVAEMTNGYMLFLPLLGVCSISYGIVRLISGPDYYREPHRITLG